MLQLVVVVVMIIVDVMIRIKYIVVMMWSFMVLVKSWNRIFYINRSMMLELVVEEVQMG